MATYTVTSRSLYPLTTQTVNAASHDAAVSAAITAQAGATGAGATGTEYYVPSCVSVPPGPTGWSAQTQYLTPLTGSTYSAVSREDAHNQHVAAKGPTGPGAVLMIRQAY